MSHAISFCAAGLFICFFLPWIRVFIVRPSGLDFAKEGGKCLLLWAIPIFSALTLLTAITKGNQKTLAQFTGVLPFVALGFALYHNGKDILQALEFGGYVSLALGLVLFILPRRIK